MGSPDESYLRTGYEPKNYDLMETYVESLTESLTEHRFLEDVDYDDTALEEKEQILAECQAEIEKHELQANYDRRSIQKLSEIIESQQEELHCAQAEELQRRDQQLLHAQLQGSWRLAVSTTSSGLASSPTYKQNQQQSLDGLGSVPHVRRIPGPLNLSRARLAAPPKLPGDMTHAFMQFWLG